MTFFLAALRQAVGPLLDRQNVDAVSQAIQQVAGCDKGARPGGIRVTRKHRGGKLDRIKVDLHDVGSKGELEQDVILRAGDVVFVPESFF